MDTFEKQKDSLPSHIPNNGAPDSSSTSRPASDEVTVSHREHENHPNDTTHKRTMDPNPEAPYPFHSEHGPPIDNALKFDEAEEDYQHHKHLWWSRVRHHLRDPFAEFMGTFIMIIFGDGSVAQVTLSANPNLPQSSQNKGEYQSISWG